MHTAQSTHWIHATRRHVDPPPYGGARPFESYIYPGHPTSYTEPALDALAEKISSDYWFLLGAAYPCPYSHFPAAEDNAVMNLRQYCSCLTPGQFRVEIFAPRLTEAGHRQIVTMGSGPSRVALHLALSQYLRKKPQSYTRTLDGFIGLNPPDGYHYTDELFWRGIGILGLLWILYGNTPPFNLSPFLLLVAGSDSFEAALKLCDDLPFVRAFAPEAADYLTSWERLARDYVADPSPIQKACRATPKYSMDKFTHLLEAVDVDLPESTLHWKMTYTQHQETREKLRNYLLFGHAHVSADVPQVSSLASGLRYFEQLKNYFVHHAFTDFQSFLYVLYRDISLDPETYLLLRVRWLQPPPDVPSNVWTDIKNALARFIRRQGLPTLTSSVASDGLRAVYATLGQSSNLPSIDSPEMQRAHIRRVLLNITVLGLEQPPSSMDFQASQPSVSWQLLLKAV
ncbi:hypothetical protein CALVIDRAFT_530982 [Calocera viscosa TUFC12733]|uniref:Uncharacterized protein n=1 Tax=Calocera viscosa (strain TUFC12733) TaxID=1330018 RepID=A0A167H2R8_CALVF|nr:hypothetical protein CALVIDRAFT_530982 [Calocera viscosa TUFC12733]